jgi:hypothetical protein
MTVLVVYDIDGDDLRMVMAARVDGNLSMISEVVRLEGKAWLANGNPYGVYGDAVSKFTGVNKFDTSIIVARCTSGSLENWK